MTDEQLERELRYLATKEDLALLRIDFEKLRAELEKTLRECRNRGFQERVSEAVVDKMSEAKITPKTGKPRKKLADYTSEEQAIIRWLERDEKRELSEQEVNLALDQARHMGNL